MQCGSESNIPRTTGKGCVPTNYDDEASEHGTTSSEASNPSVQLSGQDDGRRCLGGVGQKNHRQHLLRLQDSHNDNHSSGFSEHERRLSLLMLPPHTRHEKTREPWSLDEL